MAPVGNSIYFPSLDKSLSGEHQLISWKTALTALSKPHIIHQSDATLEDFLCDQETLELLGSPFKCFHSPSPQSRTSFETRTAAINVTPSAHGQYDIDQIKEDTLWLSKEVRLNEVSALRVVVLEWQTRPAAQLLGGFSEEETASIQDAAGNYTLGLSQIRSSSQITPTQKSDPTSFDSTDSRRLRCLNIFLSERICVLKVSQILISAGLNGGATERSSQGSGRGKSRENTTWVSRVGATVIEQQWSGKDGEKNLNTFLQQCIEALQFRIYELERGSRCFKDEGGRLEVEEIWGQTLILEMIHVMEITLVIIHSSAEITSSAITLSWFKFASKYGFFDRFEPPSAAQQSLLFPFQSMVALTSVLVLKLPPTIAHLLEASEQPPLATDVSDQSPYITSTGSIIEINSLMNEAAGAGFITASLAVFAWSVIMQTLREVSLLRKETREVRQSQRAVDGFHAANALENEEGSFTIESASLYPLLRRRSTNSENSVEPNMYEEVLEKVLEISFEGDPIAYLARSAVDGSGVFDVIASLAGDFCPTFKLSNTREFGRIIQTTLLDLISSSLGWVEYGPEVLQAILAVLTGGERYWDFIDWPATTSNLNPATIFLNDDALRQGLLQMALSRFPYETLPFLKLCKTLATCGITNDEGASRISQLLEEIKTFTQVLPPTFRGYGAIREEENANYVCLKQNLRLFVERKGRQGIIPQEAGQQNALAQVRGNDGLCIPEGTVGRVVNESKPPIVVWEYHYSGFKYLGRLLETALAGSHLTAYSSDIQPSSDTITEIVGLLAVLLSTAVKSANAAGDYLTGVNAALRVLEEASEGLDRNRDVVALILDVFEEVLHMKPGQSSTEHSMDLLISCVQFIHALIPVLPSRVWQFLARSKLLENDGRAGKLASVVEASEMVTGHYSFLMGCVHIFEGLVEDAATHAIARKVATTKVAGRFTETEARVAGIPDKTMMKVLLAYERTMVAVMENSPTWVFAVPEDKLEINTRLMSTFQRIIGYSHNIIDSSNPSERIFMIFAPAAQYLIDVFLTISSNDLPAHAVLHIFYEGVETPNTTLFLSKLDIWTSYIRAALSFATLLIQVSTLLQRSTSHLECQLFKATPILTQLYALHEAYRVPVVDLLRAIIISSASCNQEPPSLLSNLGQETAKNFLAVLSVFDRPLNDERMVISIWNLLSAIVSNHQKWFAIYLLTGSTPRDSLKNTKKTTGPSSTRGRPLLVIALDSLSEIATLPPERALAMLEFVALAKDNWPWAMSDVHKHPNFLKAISGYVQSLNSQASSKEAASLLLKCNRTRMASYIADILAMCIHHCRQLGDIAFAKKTITSIEYFINNAVTVPGYNPSLHGNLRRNFEMKFPGCDLASFKRTQLRRQSFGRGYYYDIDLLDNVLNYDQAWIGTRNQGFAEEVARANINFSLVESQVFLLHSWKLLAVELSSTLPLGTEFQRKLAKVIHDCLASNAQSTLPESIFSRLVQVRADLAFVLMQRLVEAKSKEPEVKAILAAAWTTIRTCGISFDISSSPSDMEYYRTLLKILFLAIQAHATDSLQSGPVGTTHGISSTGAHQLQRANNPETTHVILEILDVVVAKGFRSLATRLHDDPKQSSTVDFALLTAILRISLRTPDIEKSQSKIVMLFAEAKIARYASTLFSWAEQLAINGDPVYGELSMLFLLELSSLPMMAEHLAVEGLLSHITGASIMDRYRHPNGIGSFDDQPRLYAIWTRGILSLCLNLLDSVGAGIAGEIAAFLNQFSSQLSRSAISFDSKRAPTPANPTSGCLTLGLASEAHSLSLLSLILDNFRAAGASLGVTTNEISQLQWDRSQVKEDLEGWLQERKLLRDRILPVTEKELDLTRQKPLSSDSGAENRLEEKVVMELGLALRCLGGPNIP